jgi:hypothetical protein
MATKQELETENEVLKKQLSELEPLKTGDNAALLQEITDLKDQLSKVTAGALQENDVLKTTLDLLEKEKKLHQDAVNDAKAWKKKHDEAASSVELASNEILWQGKARKVVHVNSVRELKEDMHKRFVAAELTAIVIDEIH